MPTPTDNELIGRWKDRPAPLLPLLHSFHERDGYLSDQALAVVSKGLRIPIAELYGTVTFYHHLSRDEGGLRRPRVCVGPVCETRGVHRLLADLEDAGESPLPIPCPGRCDDPIPVIRGHDVWSGPSLEGLRKRPAPPPPPPLTGVRECVFRHVRENGRATLAGYRAAGGYEGLRLAKERLSPDAVIAAIEESGLAGKGGAGFPTGRKWRAVADAPRHPKTIACNADEGEPGCFKDRALMDLDPHAVIEGMAIAAYATGATRGFIYLRYEYPETFDILERALSEARDAGLIANPSRDRTGAHGSEANANGGSGRDGGPEVEILLRRGAGAYICGEETSMLNSLEGKRPFPRERPPFPVTHGFEDLPTVVNNVETLASVPTIIRRGADGPSWYRALGLGGHAGTKVISLSGDVKRPGNYEVPMGFSLERLLDGAGGPPPGRHFQAVTMAGLSGGFLSASEMEGVTLDEPSIRAQGSFLGAGGIMVFDDSRDMIDVARAAMEFFADESCGKCFPCRIGTTRLVERLGDGGPDTLTAWLDEVNDLNRTMKETSACGLGQAAPLLTESLMRGFPELVRAHVESRSIGLTGGP